jgi:hypothetical protein
MRIRLNSTVVKVNHQGDPASAKEVEVSYFTGLRQHNIGGRASGNPFDARDFSQQYWQNPRL